MDDRMTTTRSRRAIGIVRVSQRDDDSGHSPEVQVRAMLKQAAAEGFALDPADIWDENVNGTGHVRPASGGASLADRPKLLAAVEAVERGDAGVIVAERFDRLFRDLDVQRAVIRRVEAVGGKLATAAGMITHATAEAELHANLNGAISQYQKRTAMERSFDAVEVAIEQGRVPWKSTTPGYDVDDDGRLVPNAKAPAVEQAFRLRADGATVAQVRMFLRKRGIERSFHGVGVLLASRVVLGEIHFGEHTPNLRAHPPIVDRELWERVQRVKVPRGRRAKSDRLLARLGLLRCASCDARMSVGTANHGGYPLYRCPPTGDCTARVTVSAERVEEFVVRTFLAGVDGIRAQGATAAADVTEAAEAAQRAQADLDAALRAFAGLDGEQAARERLQELRDSRDRARKNLDRARDAAGIAELDLHADLDRDEWERLTVADRRRLLAAGLDAVVVTRGRAPVEGRVTVRWRGPQ